MSLLFINRIKKEQTQMKTNLPPEIKCYPCEDSIHNYEGQIMGPPDSPYEKGVFIIDIKLPENYPFEPPVMRFKTPIYHPNIDEAGRICMNLLKTTGEGNWNPSENIQSLLMAIMVLMADPNPDDPLMPNIANEYTSDRNSFNENAILHTKKFAIDNNTIKLDNQIPQDLFKPPIESDIKPVTTIKKKKLSLSTKPKSTTALPIILDSNDQQKDDQTSVNNHISVSNNSSKYPKISKNSAVKDSDSSALLSAKKIKTLGMRRPVSSTLVHKKLSSKSPNISPITNNPELENSLFINQPLPLSTNIVSPSKLSKPNTSCAESEISVSVSLTQNSNSSDVETTISSSSQPILKNQIASNLLQKEYHNIDIQSDKFNCNQNILNSEIKSDYSKIQKKSHKARKTKLHSIIDDILPDKASEHYYVEITSEDNKKVEKLNYTDSDYNKRQKNITGHENSNTAEPENTFFSNLETHNNQNHIIGLSKYDSDSIKKNLITNLKSKFCAFSNPNIQKIIARKGDNYIENLDITLPPIKKSSKLTLLKKNLK
ncbi:hypothetical protein BB561_003608 [Smittium simulii]|uniref:UBC core domain-containing protein n=1 Tax=Smittium simulii TaxID=133385 RepID=A0A2T9YKE0_9FUNG|nr:hypothetical protein BB561_003608 [Smittium simulii]